MKNLTMALIAVTFIMASALSNANIDIENKQSSKTANQFCSQNDECVDVVAMELDALYYQGLNEPRNTSIGTLINRKEKYYIDYCKHSKEKLKYSCESYKNQLMLKYITGLLDR